MSFKFKMVLAIALVEAIALVILISSTTRIMTQTNNDQIDRYVETATRIFSATIKDALIAYDLATLYTYTEELAASPDIIAARITNLEGQTMAEAGQAFWFDADAIEDKTNRQRHEHYRVSQRSVAESDTEFGSVHLILDVSQSIHGIQKAKNQATFIAVIEIIVAALVSIFLGFYLTRQLKNLEAQTKKIQDGDLSTRIPVVSKDELGRVSESFNDMMDSLEIQRRLRTEYEGQLKQLNTELENRVERRTKDLKEANSKLLTTNKQLQDTRAELVHKEKFASLGRFAGGAAHEINNPLSVINGNLEVLGEYIEVYRNIAVHIESIANTGEISTEVLDSIKTLLDNEDLAFLNDDSPKLLEQMQNGSQRIGSIIEDLTLFKSNYNNSKTELEAGSTVINIVSEFASAHPNRITFDDQTKQLAFCEINKSQLCTALHAILQNAIDFSEESSPISVQLISYANEFETKIIDSGYGISEDAFDKVLEPFFTTKRVGDGTGMGLTVSESIIQGFGGSLNIVRNKDKGMTVSIKFPVYSEQKANPTD